ncbi:MULTISPECIES: DUF6284 family protein [unclassified Streptomyces]|uniref:DUF6284 family protein n=1 Tax=unclassified Streptomyces TaxID=2593676 RepID=UPI002E359B18|nr:MULTISPECIES: DUF6284 family protein [unclassified Streptomyces]WUC65888.1 DUF6284 family protein [Streptomyces sp. NBC_00539]
MKPIAALHDVVTPWSDGLEPSDAELDAIETEMPVVLAEVELLDALIALLDRPASELDARRIRRTRNRVLAARRDMANRTAGATVSGDAA